MSLLNLKKNIKFQTDITISSNPNELDFSHIFDYATDTGVHSGTEIGINSSTGEGELSATGASGTWTSPNVNLTSNLSAIEPRISGNDLNSVLLRISTDGGNIFTPIIAGVTTLTAGRNIKLQIVINSSTTKITSSGFLYSF